MSGSTKRWPPVTITVIIIASTVRIIAAITLVVISNQAVTIPTAQDMAHTIRLISVATATTIGTRPSRSAIAPIAWQRCTPSHPTFSSTIILTVNPLWVEVVCLFSPTLIPQRRRRTIAIRVLLYPGLEDPGHLQRLMLTSQISTFSFYGISGTYILLFRYPRSLRRQATGHGP